MNIALAIIIAYLLGSISFGVVFCKIFGKEDVRKFGSGNAGTTNILRTYGKGAAILVLAGDAIKGALGCYAGMMLISNSVVRRAVSGSCLFCNLLHTC